MSYYLPTNEFWEIHDNPEGSFNDLVKHFDQTGSDAAFDDLTIDLVDEFNEISKDDHESVASNSESDRTDLNVDTSNVDLSEIEADLEEILSQRLADEDDLADEDEDDHHQLQRIQETPGETTFQCCDEWLCKQCFLIVSKSQFGSPQSPICPSSEYPCEGIERMFCR